MKVLEIRKSETGFTLIEVLLSITLLGIISLSTLAFFSQAYDYTKRNESKTVGINVARNVLNYFEGLDYQTVYPYIMEQEKEILLTSSSCNLSETRSIFGDCENTLDIEINNVPYKATVTFPELEEKEQYLKDGIINVAVTVEWSTNQSTSLQGVIQK